MHKQNINEQARAVRTYTRGFVNLASEIKTELKIYENRRKMSPGEFVIFLELKAVIAGIVIPTTKELQAEVNRLQEIANADD